MCFASSRFLWDRRPRRSFTTVALVTWSNCDIRSYWDPVLIHRPIGLPRIQRSSVPGTSRCRAPSVLLQQNTGSARPKAAGEERAPGPAKRPRYGGRGGEITGEGVYLISECALAGGWGAPPLRSGGHMTPYTGPSTWPWPAGSCPHPHRVADRNRDEVEVSLWAYEPMSLMHAPISLGCACSSARIQRERLH